MKSFTSFPLLDTIEIDVHYSHTQDLPLGELAASDVKEASKILKENKSQAEKTVIVTQWSHVLEYGIPELDVEEGYMTRDAIKV